MAGGSRQNQTGGGEVTASATPKPQMNTALKVLLGDPTVQGDQATSSTVEKPNTFDEFVKRKFMPSVNRPQPQPRHNTNNPNHPVSIMLKNHPFFNGDVSNGVAAKTNGGRGK